MYSNDDINFIANEVYKYSDKILQKKFPKW